MYFTTIKNKWCWVSILLPHWLNIPFECPMIKQSMLSKYYIVLKLSMELLATVEAEWIKNIKPNSFLVHFNVLHFDLPFNFCFRICSTEKGSLIMTEDFKAPVRISFPFWSYICVCAIACSCISKRTQLSIAMISNWFTLVYWKLMRHLKFTWCSFKKNLNTSLPTSRILQDSCINIHLCFIFIMYIPWVVT